MASETLTVESSAPAATPPVPESVEEPKLPHEILSEKLTEYDGHTIGLATPGPGSKIVRCGSHYSFQAPGISQSVYRWLVGESQETTKQYIEELVTRLVALMDEGETMLEHLSIERRKFQQAQFGRRRQRFVRHEGLHDLVTTPPQRVPAPISAERIKAVTEVLTHVDDLNKRIAAVIAHVQDVYVSTGGAIQKAGDVTDDGGESVSETEEEEGDVSQIDVYEQWQLRLSEAHAALCAASTSFRA